MNGAPGASASLGWCRIVSSVSRRRRGLAACFLVLSLVPGRAGAERLPLRSYTVADGLGHNAINRIVRDSRGFLWFATADGLSRFDGYRFTNYGVDQGLPQPTVNDFLETRRGELWVATTGGLVRFNPIGTPANRIAPATAAGVSPSAMFSTIVPDVGNRYGGIVTVLLEGRDGTIWCGTMGGLFRLDPRTVPARLEPVDLRMPSEHREQHNILDLVEDASGSIWAASPSGLYVRWADGRTARYTSNDGLPDTFLHDLLIDSRGRLWVASRYKGFFRIVPGERDAPPAVVERFQRPDGLPSDWIFQLYEARDHRFWIATNAGLVEFVANATDQRSRFRAYTRRNGLSFQEITTVVEDAADNLWIGTNTAGAMRLARNGLVTYDDQDGLVAVHAIFEDATGGVCLRSAVLGDQRATAFDGSTLSLLRAGADQGLMRFGHFDGQQFDWFTPHRSFDFGWVSQQVTIRARDGQWWVGSGAGLYRFPSSSRFSQIRETQPLAVYTMRDGLAAQQIYRLFADSAGNIWVSNVATPNGLSRWDRASQTLISLAHTPGLPSLRDELPRSFAEDTGGHVWVGLNTGAARYRDGRFTFFTAADGLRAGRIVDLHTDHAGRLWMASSSGGVIRLDDPTAPHPAFTSYTTANGLSSNATEVLAEDVQGRIYVATSRGVDQVDPVAGRIKHYTTADGLAPGDVMAAFRDTSGALWFGTHRGLSRLVPAPPEALPAPPVLITAVTVAGRPHTVSVVGEREVALPDVSADRNQLQIEFVALGFAPGDVLRYQYSLEGSKDGWSALADDRTVNYASLAPGRYRFHVRAVNADGIASEVPALVTFTVLPPIWLRWWFLSLAGLVVSGSAFGLYRYRVAHLVELERVRTRIAGDLHDDIGANLTKISILSEVARLQRPARATDDESVLASIARISRESVAAMSDIVWAVDPRRDSLHDLVQRMRLHAEETCLPRAIELEFNAPDGGRVSKLSVDTRRDLYLMFKEAVNNAARHSGCTRLQVVLVHDTHRLSLTVRDNGRGFDPDAAHDGNGVVNMRRRAEARAARLEIESGALTGTVVHLRIET